MKFAKDIKQGQTLRIDGKLYQVVSFDYHSSGKMVTAANAQLRDLGSGNISVRHFKPDEKIDDIHLDRKNMEFLYESDGNFYFMDPDNYEQFSLPGSILGEAASFLQANTLIPISFFEDKPVSATLPDAVILKVELTAPPVSGETHQTSKEAVLENGLKTLVPQFIKMGDKVKINVESKKFLERIKDAK